MKHGRTLQELAAEIERQAAMKKDLIVTHNALKMEANEYGTNLYVGDGSNQQSLNVNDVAHRQVREHLKIPAQYYDRMKSDYPELLAQNVNGWFSKSPNTRRMLRTLDGTARAYLSDRYRRIDNLEIAEAVLPIIGNIPGATVESCELTDERLYIKAVDPRVTAEISKGDVVQAGVVITNSEVGLGSVSVTPLIYRLVCLNGMIAADAGMRKYHVGRLNEANDADYTIYRDETIEADDKAFLLKLEDNVNAAISQLQFDRLVGKMREAKDAKIEAMVAPMVVELTAKEFKLNDGERQGVLGHLIEGGELSLYGLGNAVTRAAQDVQSYDRSTELEATGYQIITMSPSLWKHINSLAAA